MEKESESVWLCPVIFYWQVGDGSDLIWGLSLTIRIIVTGFPQSLASGSSVTFCHASPAQCQLELGALETAD